MRRTHPLTAIAIASATGGCATATTPDRAPVEIPLRQSGRIEMRVDANICVELVAGRREAATGDDYVLSRVMAGSVSGLHRMMVERRVPEEHRNGRPRVKAIEGAYSVARDCPDTARDLRIILHLTQRRQGAPYRLDVEFRQGVATLRRGLDRLRQRPFRFPPAAPPPAGAVNDYGPPPWSLEGDAERLTLELARQVRWETEG